MFRVYLQFQRHLLLGVLNRSDFIPLKNPAFLPSSDNQEGSDWRDEDEKLPGHENLTEKDIELFRHIQELALQVRPGEGEEGASLEGWVSAGMGDLISQKDQRVGAEAARGLEQVCGWRT